MGGIGRRGIGAERQRWWPGQIGAVCPDGRLNEIEPGTSGIGAVVPELSGDGIVASCPPATSRAIITLVTPADLKQKGLRLDRLDGPVFFRRLIRRIGTLVETYCSPPPEAGTCDYHALASLSDQVVVQDQQVSIQSWERYSDRLGARHPLSGLVGQAVLANIPESLWPYLMLGQWVHLGKGASFGQGRYIVMPESGTSTNV
jgi:CRISPR-associated endoribonuclease Cas6